MEATDQCSVDKNTLEIQIKQLRIDNDQLLNQIMSQEIMHIAVNSIDILDVSKSCVDECNKCLELETELLKKKDLVEKDVYDKLFKSYSTLEKHCISLELATQLNQEIFQKDNSALKNELRKLKGKTVVDAAVSTPISTTIALGILTKPSEKLVVVTPLNKDKKVRFADPLTSSSNTQKQVDSHITQDSNKPLLHSTRVKCSTGASGSKPSGNTKNNRILQSSSSNKTNKLEDESRSVKSRKNKKNHVVKTECNAHVMQSMLHTNSKFVCAICNECLFDANHDKCVLYFAHDVNVLSKSTPAKCKNKKRKVWKPTGKVFTEIGYSWKPIGRTFTIVGNRFPLTRITSTKIVPLKETTVAPVVTPTSELKGSIVSNVPSSSPIDFRFRNDHIAKIMGYGDYQMGNVTISQVYYVEGLGHNLFSVGQFCNSDLEVAFRKHTCFIPDLEGVDLPKGSRGSNLYTLSLENLSRPRTSKTKVSKGLPVLLVKFLRSKDEVLEFVIKFLKMIQVRLNATVRNIRIDNGIEFVNRTLRAYYDEVRISHQTSVTRTPQQNGVVERRNRTLVEVARTMLIFSKASLFLWAEAVVTAC
ncbi:retrovirus-related pol polyprotein from transposon TNT 1-94 [Tanacetum coccineum]|uniref:Retrovirus-related pol polyprotein from transposon TNT 1-94 n=1 Tax=Tanacetum coccineum TaxID=301880 RepID=A0ABQ5EUR2_9ASTR